MNEEVWEKTLSPIYIIIVVFLVMFIFTSWVKGSINPLDWALTDESIGNSDQF